MDTRPLAVAAPAIRLGQRLHAGRPQHLVCYGTSLTSHGPWVDQLRGELVRRFGTLLRVSNRGEGKQDSRWGLAHLKERVIAEAPDAVTIEFAINDALARLRIPLEESRDNLTAMLTRLRTALPACQPILQVMNPAVGRPPGHTGHRPSLAAYGQMVREVARDWELPLIDHSPRWQRVLDRGEDHFLRFVPDGLHPNEEGCRRFVTPTLLEAILGDDGGAARSGGVAC